MVVDDGSTDSGPAVVASYADSRIRLIRQSNCGVSAARNRGIAEARGQWIAFLDADDEHLPAFLEEVRGCVKKWPKAGAIYARAAWMKGQAQLNLPADHTIEPRLLKDYLHFVAFENGYEIHSSAVAVRQEIFQRAGTFPVGVKIGEDSDTWLRVAWTTSIAYIPEFLAVYHMEAGESSWEESREQQPYWVGTYRRWLAERLIPAHLLDSSAAYYQKYVLEKALGQALRGSRIVALKGLLRNLQWRLAPRTLALKTLLHIVLARRVMSALRGLNGCKDRIWRGRKCPSATHVK